MNPLELMGEIERGYSGRRHMVATRQDWQSLRAAIEAQAAELEQANDIRDDAINVIAMVAEELGVDQEPHQTFNERLIEAAEKDWYKAYMESSWELAQARARIGRLEQSAINVTECLASQVPVYLEDLEQVLNESPAQSLAAVRAEALRSAASAMQLEFDANHLFIMADRIEREAKEES